MTYPDFAVITLTGCYSLPGRRLPNYLLKHRYGELYFEFFLLFEVD